MQTNLHISEKHFQFLTITYNWISSLTELVRDWTRYFSEQWQHFNSSDCQDFGCCRLFRYAENTACFCLNVSAKMFVWCYVTLTYLPSRQVATSAWLFSPFSVFQLRPKCKCWTKTDPSLLPLLYLRRIAEGTRVFLSHSYILPNNRQVMSFWGWWQHADNTWYQWTYIIGSEILIRLAANLLECKYYEYFGPDKILHIITIIFFSENMEFQSTPLLNGWIFFIICFS